MTSLILYSLFFYLSFTNVGAAAAAAAAAGAAANSKASLVGTAANSKVSLVRYWNIQISNDLPKPWFLLNKASPLTAVESETFSELANDPNAIADQLRSLCSSANLFCFPDLSLGHGETYVRDDGDVNVDCCFFYRYKGGKKSPPPSPPSMGMTTMAHRGKAVKTWVEPGIFFRERMLTSGTIMRMPDIRDKTPKRSFLPRVVSTKLPFSTSKIPEMRKIYQAAENSTMAIMLAAAVTNCERAPSAGEKKRCVGCVEDMMDFAISILGRNLTVLTTLNDAGSKNNVKIGKARAISAINNGTAISCHQILFPYLLYYCHSVPEVRVYKAEILDPHTNIKINNAVALCHLDTSSWSSDHGAFLALGFGPGKIEVCHWVFQNDMAWIQIY